MNEPKMIYPDKMFVKIRKVDSALTEDEFKEFMLKRFHRYELVEYSNGGYLFKRKKELV